MEAVDGGSDEIDHHFKSMTRHPTLHHFKKGISLVLQWTGNKFKNMEKTFLGVIAGAVDEWVIRAVHGMVDFISYAHFETHTESSLERMDRAWSAIHENKSIFVELGICKKFNIPKFHSLIHYISAICSHGTLNSYNTETPEHLHIDFVKAPFRAGNKRDYTVQMATWMSRHDTVQHYKGFLCWVKGEGIVNDDDDEVEPKRKWWQVDNDMEERVCGHKVAKVPGYGMSGLLGI